MSCGVPGPAPTNPLTLLSPSPENSREDGDYFEVGMRAKVRKNVGKLDKFLGQAVIQEYRVTIPYFIKVGVMGKEEVERRGAG